MVHRENLCKCKTRENEIEIEISRVGGGYEKNSRGTNTVRQWNRNKTIYQKRRKLVERKKEKKEKKRVQPIEKCIKK